MPLHPSSKNRRVFLLFIIMFFLGVSYPANLFVDDVFGSFCSCHLHLLGSKERDRSFKPVTANGRATATLFLELSDAM